MGLLDPILSRARWWRTSGDMQVNDLGTLGTMGSTTINWLGNDTFGPGSTHQTVYGATALPAVHRATQLLTGPIVRAPWLVNGEPAPLWIRDPMLAATAPGPVGSLYPALDRLPRSAFWSQILSHAILYGAGYLMFAPNATGQPIPGSLRALNPLSVEHDDGVLVLTDPDTGTRYKSDQDGQIGDFRVLPIRGPAPFDEDGKGRGVITDHGATLGLAAELATYTRGTVSNSGIPSGYLKVQDPAFTSDDAAELKRRWSEAHSGARNTAVLNATTDYQAVSVTPVDAQLDAAKRTTLVELAHCFNLSGWALDASTDSVTYANVSDRRQDLLDFSISPLSQSLLQSLSTVLPYGQEFGIDWRAFLSTDTTQRLAYYQAGLDQGWLTVEQIAEYEGTEAPQDV